jgi:hypothetical protein
VLSMLRRKSPRRKPEPVQTYRPFSARSSRARTSTAPISPRSGNDSTSSGDSGSSAAAARTARSARTDCPGHDRVLDPGGEKTLRYRSRCTGPGEVVEDEIGRRSRRVRPIFRTAARKRRACPGIRSARCTPRSRFRFPSSSALVDTSPCSCPVTIRRRSPCAPPGGTPPVACDPAGLVPAERPVAAERVPGFAEHDLDRLARLAERDEAAARGHQVRNQERRPPRSGSPVVQVGERGCQMW